MLRPMIPLSLAVFALVFIGSDATQSSARAVETKFDPITSIPVDATTAEQGPRLIAAGEDDYPSPVIDGDDPDIRIPGDARK